MKSEFTIGTVLRPRGLKGEVKMELYTSDSTRYRALKTAKVGEEVLKIEKISPEGEFAYVKFFGTDSAEDAEKLRGKPVTVSRSDLPRPKDGEHYIADLIGMDVFVGNDRLGELVDVLQYGSADVYVIKTESAEVSVPALKELVKDVDLEKGVIALDRYVFDRVSVYN